MNKHSLPRISRLFLCFVISLLMTKSYAVTLDEQDHYDIIIATPNQCVALNQGQVCYQDVTLVWRSARQGDFCVRTSQFEEPLQCWQNQREGEVALSVEAAKSVLFTLNKTSNNDKLAEALMRVAWVYKQKREKIASWRLF